MNWKRIKLGFYLALIYWIPATLVLLGVLYGNGTVFSSAIDIFLMPGYFIGFGLAFGGGNILGIIGQLITLLILTILMLPFTYFFKIKDSRQG